MAKQTKGISVGEIEKYTKQYSVQIWMIIAIVIAMISTIFDFFVSANWSVLLATAGVVIGLLTPRQIDAFLDKMAAFSSKDRTTEILTGIVRIIVAIFIPALLFGVVGLLAGTACHKHFKHHA